jgi:hypothetical protein
MENEDEKERQDTLALVEEAYQLHIYETRNRGIPSDGLEHASITTPSTAVCDESLDEVVDENIRIRISPKEHFKRRLLDTRNGELVATQVAPLSLINADESSLDTHPPIDFQQRGGPQYVQISNDDNEGVNLKRQFDNLTEARATTVLEQEQFPSDLVGRAPPIVRIQHEIIALPAAIVPAYIYGEVQQQQQQENPDQQANVGETNRPASTSPLHELPREQETHNHIEKTPEDVRSIFPKSEKRFWITVIFLAFTLNSMLVAGLTTGIFLLLSSDQYKLSTAPEPFPAPPPPTMAPTSVPVVVASEAPTPFDHASTGPTFPNITEAPTEGDVNLVVTPPPSTFKEGDATGFTPPPSLEPSTAPIALDEDYDAKVKTIPIGAIIGIALVAEILIMVFLYIYYRMWKQRRQPFDSQKTLTEATGDDTSMA